MPLGCTDHRTDIPLEKESDLEFYLEPVIPLPAIVYHVRYLIETKDLFMACIGIEQRVLFTLNAEIFDRYLSGICRAYLQRSAFLAERLATAVTTHNCNVFAAVITQSIRHLFYSHILFHGC